MSDLKIAAAFASALWLAWSIAYYAEGFSLVGSVGLKTLGFVAEVALWLVLIWVLFF